MRETLKGEDRALDPQRALRLLREACGEGAGRIHRVTDIEVRKRRPGRRLTLRYELEIKTEGGTKRRRIYAKLYSGHRGARCHQALRALQGARLEGLRLPDPLGYHARFRCLVLEELPGSSLAERLAEPDAPGCLADFGRALAILHRVKKTAVPGLPRHDAAAELAVLEQAAGRLAAGALPATLTGRFRRCLALLRDALPESKGAEPSLIHRDLYPGQVLAYDGGFGLVDLDELCRGEAELDLGNFVAHLLLRDHQAERGSAGGQKLSARFLAGYQAAQPFRPGRTRLYTAASLLRLASLERLAAPHRSHLDWLELAGALVKDAELQLTSSGLNP